MRGETINKMDHKHPSRHWQPSWHPSTYSMWKLQTSKSGATLNVTA